MKRRTLVGGLFVGFIVLGVIGILIIMQSIRNAPLQVGSGTPSPAIAATLPRSLAFNTQAGGDWDIVVMTDGVLNNLTLEGNAHDYFASWSLDGQQINFLSNRLNVADLNPTQVQADGQSLRSLNVVQAILTLAREGRFDWDPAWSPDRQTLLWASVRDLNLELYTIQTDQAFTVQNATRQTNRGARDWFASWSPDGTRLVFNSDLNGNEDLFLLDLASGTITQLTDNPADDIHGMWSLDGESLMFVSERQNELATGTVDLYLMNPDGSNQRPIGDTIFRGDPVFAPESDLMAFVSNESGYWQVYVRTSDEVQQVSVDEADHLFPVWRP